ncbi:MAG: dTDP-4-dehydrorhamnose reductase [Pseudomonadota bacterium]|jgi:dTDP-4-dehydrorhamnose reductase
MSSVYNVCGGGYCSWYEFATEIFRLAPEFGYSLKVNTIKPIPSSDYPTPAKRPLNSRLSQAKLKRDLGLEMPLWQESLRVAFKNLR